VLRVGNGGLAAELCASAVFSAGMVPDHQKKHSLLRSSRLCFLLGPMNKQKASQRIEHWKCTLNMWASICA